MVAPSASLVPFAVAVPRPGQSQSSARVDCPLSDARRPRVPHAVRAVYHAWPHEPEKGMAADAPNLHVVRDADLFRVDAWPALPERNSIRRVCLVTHPNDFAW